MARLGRNIAAVVLLAGIGAAAYVTRDRWLHYIPGQAQTAATSETNAGTSANPTGRRGARGGGRGARSANLGPVPVLTAEVKTADVPVTIDGVGTVQAFNTVTVLPQVGGKLVQILFKEGQDVKKGDVLAKIDDTLYRATLDQAIAKKAQDQSTLENSQRDLERYINLVQTNSITKQQADTQRATVAQNQAQLQSDTAAIESAQATLGYTSIIAPIDGRTGIRNVDVGNIVSTTGTTGLVTISQIQPISVIFTVPQQNLSRVNKASAAGTLAVSALGDDGATIIDQGTLSVIDNAVDPTTGTVRLKATFPNAALALWPGAFVNARLMVDTLKGVLVVPTSAVQRGPSGTFVYVVVPAGAAPTMAPDAAAAADPSGASAAPAAGTAPPSNAKKVAMKTVMVGQQDDVQAVITSGVAVSDIVVTTGFAQLSDGARVQVQSPNPPSPGGDAAPADPNAPPTKGQHHRRNSNQPAQ